MRIIAGEFGGRTLAVPRGRATRPTLDRVREALFSILGDVEGASVLDLFAGTGALGFEALSRGAASVAFVDEARAALDALRKNTDALGVDDRVAIVAADARTALARLAKEARRFGLVFLDPPYAGRDVPQVLEALVAGGLLVDGAWIVLEHAARDAAPAAPGGLELRFTRTYGDTSLAFYRQHGTEGP